MSEKNKLKNNLIWRKEINCYLGSSGVGFILCVRAILPKINASVLGIYAIVFFFTWYTQDAPFRGFSHFVSLLAVQSHAR